MFTCISLRKVCTNTFCCRDLFPKPQKTITNYLICAITVELQWLEHLLNHENMFEAGVVRATECSSLQQVMGHNRDICSIFFNMTVSCMFSLGSPHRGDSNEYTQYTIFNIKKKIAVEISQICSCSIFQRNS